MLACHDTSIIAGRIVKIVWTFWKKAQIQTVFACLKLFKYLVKFGEVFGQR